MDYEESMRSIDDDGFRWDRLRTYFPFGDVELREGDYQRLLEKALSRLAPAHQKQLLLDLLDAQTCVFVEQLWVQNEQMQTAGMPPPFLGEAHFAMALLQINDNVRQEHQLPSRGTRAVMLALSPNEMLVSRMAIR